MFMSLSVFLLGRIRDSFPSRIRSVARSLVLLVGLGLALTSLACASQPEWEEPKGARAGVEEPVEPGVEVDPEGEDEEEPERSERPPRVSVR